MAEIEHKGKIIAINKNILIVAFGRNESCNDCQIKHSCSLHDIKVQTIELWTENPENYNISQEVSVIVSLEAGIVAVTFAYIIPLFIMLAVLFGIWFYTKNEAYAGIISLLALLPYYAIIYLFNKKLKNGMEIRIR
jgi:sigma-E factor negative regulatory protein RseC